MKVDSELLSAFRPEKFLNKLAIAIIYITAPNTLKNERISKKELEDIASAKQNVRFIKLSFPQAFERESIYNRWIPEPEGIPVG